ncbi:hypothetical protein P2H44_14040 [Albimonas sp. CAU 1670]|uniref:hypothetical protein n=1 Tax=Albimonas sp. CAU 1670 TaxID=3032599 RepID=UPI0023DB0457|nr:hypothetical protein [Albimonas sp. CAU 1670]MDF2233677.1 hypothetical protein [Albimonas sp. CAU 1670]
MKRTIAILAGCLLAAAPAAQAQSDDQGAIADKVRGLSIAIGNAYACTDEADRPTFKEEAHHLFDLILQDVGSDIAFLYATGLGYGSAVPAAEIDCPAMLEQWEGIRTDYDLKAEE